MNMSAHLTDDQLEDALMGDLSAVPAAHLEVCESCRRRLESEKSSLAAFNSVSLNWSEQRSSTLPVLRGRSRSAWVPQVALPAAAAVLLLAVAVPAARFAFPARHSTQSVATAPAGSTAPSESQIAQDNQMLSAIDLELQGSTPATLDSLQLKSVAVTAGRHATLRGASVRN